MRNSLLMVLCGLLVGCATDIAVRGQSYEHQKISGEKLAIVTVNDRRAAGVAASKREAAFGVPMGNITFDPPETQQVKSVLETELSRLMMEKGLNSKKEYSCDIIEFGVNTNTTPLYWDVIGRIQLVLKYNSKEYNLFGTNTERTYLWPVEKIIKKVVDASFKQIISGLDIDM